MRSPRTASRLVLFVVACVLSASACPAATYVIPAPLAPVSLNGTFPMRITLSAVAVEGTLTTAIDAKGGVTGQFDGNGKIYTVTGKQSFKNGTGTLSMTAVSGAEKVSFKGTLKGSKFAGSAKGSGEFAGASGTFELDCRSAEPLIARLSLNLNSDAKGTLTGTGTATVAGASVTLTAKGKGGSKFSLAVKGTGVTWSGKGVARSGGYLIATKVAGYGASSGESELQISAITSDLGKGVISFTGTRPALGRIVFSSGTFTGELDASIGQAIVFFTPTTSASAADAAIQSSGGTIAAAVPNAGYYLVQVSSGAEAAFIASITANAGVTYAAPHVESRYMSVNTYIIDDCSGKDSHGKRVGGAFEEAGGSQYSCLDDDDGAGNPILDETLKNIFKIIAENGNQPVLINLSTNGGYNAQAYPGASDEFKKELQRKWLAVMEVYLNAILSLTEQQRENLVLTICAGNDDMPLDEMLAELRKNPKFAELLKYHILVVGATEEAYSGSNYAANDPDMAYMTYSRDPHGTAGTSFAAPRALAIIQKLVLLKKLTARQALALVKKAILQNANHALVESEALALADVALDFAPIISVSPTALTFTYKEGDPVGPQQQAVFITNTGSDSSVLHYDIVAAGSFISLSLPNFAGLSGGKQIGFGVGALTGSLKPGTYTGKVTVSDPKASNKFVVITVTLTIAPKTGGGGGGPEVYTGTATMTDLHTFPTPGSTPDPYTITTTGTFEVELHVNKSFLSAGTYTGTYSNTQYIETSEFPAHTINTQPPIVVPASTSTTTVPASTDSFTATGDGSTITSFTINDPPNDTYTITATIIRQGNSVQLNLHYVGTTVLGPGDSFTTTIDMVLTRQ